MACSSFAAFGRACLHFEEAGDSGRLSSSDSLASWYIWRRAVRELATLKVMLYTFHLEQHARCDLRYHSRPRDLISPRRVVLNERCIASPSGWPILADGSSSQDDPMPRDPRTQRPHPPLLEISASLDKSCLQANPAAIMLLTDLRDGRTAQSELLSCEGKSCIRKSFAGAQARVSSPLSLLRA